MALFALQGLAASLPLIQAVLGLMSQIVTALRTLYRFWKSRANLLHALWMLISVNPDKARELLVKLRVKDDRIAKLLTLVRLAPVLVVDVYAHACFDCSAR